MAETVRAVRPTAPVERRAAAIEAALEAPGLEGRRGHRRGDRARSRRSGCREWRARRGPRMDRPSVPARLLANGRSAVTELGIPMPKTPSPPGRAGEHARDPQCHLLLAVFVHRLHRDRSAAGLVQGPRVPRSRRARVAHRTPRDGPRPATGGRDPGVGHDRRHPLHGAAVAASAERRLAGRKACFDRHPGLDDRRGSSVGDTHGRDA